MNALLKKEIRLLWPSWAIALVLALSASLVADQNSSSSIFRVYVLVVLPFLAGPAMVVMLALDSFGRELSAGTFPNLLAQPLARSRIWWTKTLLLAAALISVCVVWWVCVGTNRDYSMSREQQWEMFQITVLLVVTVYSGGLWTVLALRQVAAAFWFTWLVPAALAMLTLYFTKEFGGDEFYEARFPGIVTVVLLVYSLAGFVWAYRLFHRAQDVHWTGGEITLPGWMKLARPSVTPARLRGHPRLALIAKELHLHQSQFIIAGAFALLHLGLIVARNVSGGFKESPTLEFVSYQIWALWPLMGLLIGCAAVAEERSLGTLETHLCLPVRRRTQFLVKFGVALVLAVFFGVALPLLFEGRRVLPELSFGLNYSTNPNQFSELVLRSFPGALAVLRFIEPMLPFLPQTAFAVIFLCAAFFASTLARTTLQAIAPAIIGIIAAVTTLFGAAHVENLIPVPLWRGGLIYLIGGPVMAVTLGGLALWNYKRVLVGWPVWRRNLGVLAFALVAVTSLTTAIYQRVWELFGRLEPAHGAPRLAEATGVHLDLLGQRISAWSPEGRAWSAWLDFEKSDISAALTGGLYAPAPIAAGRFLEGTNWVSVAFGLEDVMASHSDGSLWVSEGADAGRRFREDQSQHPVKLKRHGSDHDWMSLVANWMSVLAVKSDGTLWRIGTNRFSKRPWPGWRGFEPYRLDTETNWAEVFSLGDRTAFRKTDGRFYVSPPYTANPSERLKLDDETTLEHVSYLEQNRWRGLTSVYGVYGGFAAVIQVGVAEDGRLYVLSGFRDPFRPPAEPAVLGQETNWIAVVGNYGQTVTLKSDGTLWVWHFPENPVTDPQSAYATQLGEHSDWRAVMEAGDGIIALAADGSLWSWRFIPRGTPHFWSLLRPTRHPRLLGNIFAPAQ